MDGGGDRAPRPPLEFAAPAELAPPSVGAADRGTEDGLTMRMTTIPPTGGEWSVTHSVCREPVVRVPIPVSAATRLLFESIR